MSSAKKNRLSRRALLRGAGGVAIALPLLEIMGCKDSGSSGSSGRGASSSASAASAGAASAAGVGAKRMAATTGPKRFVVFFSANGTIEEKWKPIGSPGGSFSLAKSGEQRILAPLEKHRSDLVVISGLDMKSRSHGPGSNGHDLGMGHALTGAPLVVGPSGKGDFGHLPDGSAGGPSIDQEVAKHIGTKTRFSSLELGVRCGLDAKRQITSRMCYRGPFKVVPPENDPVAAFNTLFAGYNKDKAQLDAIRARRQSVIDRVRADYQRLARRLGKRDKAKIDSHLTAIREVELSLQKQASGSGSCTPPTAPGKLDFMRNDNYPAVGKAQMDLLVSALSCDLTRVASLQWSTAQSGARFTWLGHKDSHHALSHEANSDANARKQLVEINHWYAQQFAYLIDRMKAVKEGDGTMLDNTVLVWVNEQGDGDRHTKTEIPYVLAGSGGGAFKTGRYHHFADRAHNDLFVTILNAFGVQAKTFGLADVCKGPLSLS